VGHAQWVFTIPKILRAYFLRNRELLGDLSRGIEQNTHKIGECMDSREFPPVVAFLARFPSVYQKQTNG
jgi:hypothetical protein